MFHELSLFSGYCGMSLSLRMAGIPTRTIAYVEIDKYCQDITKARIRDGLLDDGPIFPDIRSFNGLQCRGLVDIVTSGTPCQWVSLAGINKGQDISDERNLWPDTLRVISEVGPRWVLLENPPNILVRGYAGTIIGQLSEQGYDCIWDTISAAEVGAPHLRYRWWCLATAGAYADSPPSGCRDHGVGQTLSVRSTQEGDSLRSISWWDVKSPLGRVANGTPDRVGQLRALGNGVVPAVVAKFLRGKLPPE